MKFKTLLLSLILVSSLLLSFNSSALITEYGSFTDFRFSKCDPFIDAFCEDEVDNGRKTKIGYRQDLSSSDSYLANCEKEISITGALFGISACEAARNKKASMVSANTAYNNGDYKKAFNIYKPLAELAQGDAIAQQRLGQMYYEGKGVPQDYNEAVYWYSNSYNHGYVTAKEYERILSRGRIKGFNPNNFQYNLDFVHKKELR